MNIDRQPEFSKENRGEKSQAFMGIISLEEKIKVLGIAAVYAENKDDLLLIVDVLGLENTLRDLKNTIAK